MGHSELKLSWETTVILHKLPRVRQRLVRSRNVSRVPTVVFHPVRNPAVLIKPSPCLHRVYLLLKGNKTMHTQMKKVLDGNGAVLSE